MKPKNKAAQALGRLGGKKTSKKKKDATKKSLAKARQARWKVKPVKKIGTKK